MPDQHKMHKPIPGPRVKADHKLPHYYKFKMRWCQNGNVDVANKSIRKFSPTVLADSIIFSVDTSEDSQWVHQHA